MNAEVRESWQGKNVIGLIPGTIDEYVVVTAHLDGYFDSANDNAGGVAAALALARHFSGVPAMNRNLLFVGTSAHHEFSDGSRAFIAAHPDILEKTVLVFNIEHPSSIKSYYRGPLKLERVTVPGQLIVTTSQGKRSLTISNGNPLLLSIYQDGVDRYGLVVDAMVGRHHTVNGGGLDNAASFSLGDHLLTDRLSHQKHAVQIHGHNFTPLFQAVFLKRRKESMQVI